MTPDVSGVLAAVEEYATLTVPYLRRKVGDPDPETGDQDWEDYPDPTAEAQFATEQTKVQQAAEQACYRYARRVLDEIWSYGVGEQPRRVYVERDRLRQLIAGSV